MTESRTNANVSECDTWVAEQQRASLVGVVETLRNEIRKLDGLVDENGSSANGWELDAWYRAKTALRNAIQHMTGIPEPEYASCVCECEPWNVTPHGRDCANCGCRLP